MPDDDDLVWALDPLDTDNFIKETGYLYKDEDSVNPHLKCPICDSPLVDPVGSRRCRHTFCRGCITSWLNSGDNRGLHNCPVDRKTLSIGDLNEAPSLVTSLLDELSVLCPLGCGWAGTREDYWTHLNVKCPEVEVDGIERRVRVKHAWELRLQRMKSQGGRGGMVDMPDMPDMLKENVQRFAHTLNHTANETADLVAALTAVTLRDEQSDNQAAVPIVAVQPPAALSPLRLSNSSFDMTELLRDTSNAATHLNGDSASYAGPPSSSAAANGNGSLLSPSTSEIIDLRSQLADFRKRLTETEGQRDRAIAQLPPNSNLSDIYGATNAFASSSGFGSASRPPAHHRTVSASAAPSRFKQLLNNGRRRVRRQGSIEGALNAINGIGTGVASPSLSQTRTRDSADASGSTTASAFGPDDANAPTSPRSLSSRIFGRPRDGRARSMSTSGVPNGPPGDIPAVYGVVHEGIQCDCCGESPIVGIRYKCAEAACPDVDLCGKCVTWSGQPRPGSTARSHVRSHTMLRLVDDGFNTESVKVDGRRLS